MDKKSRGRQKIEMMKMSKGKNLLVTFSKRRSGLFKKASELSTLCGAEIAILVFSPANKAFSFGHPSVDAILNRFLGFRASQGSGGTSHLVEAHRSAGVRELNNQMTDVMGKLEAERKRGEELEKIRKIGREKQWWEAPVETMRLHELEQLRLTMEDLKKEVGKQAEKVMLEASNPPPFYNGGSESGLGLSMTPHGYALGYGDGFF